MAHIAGGVNLDPGVAHIAAALILAGLTDSQIDDQLRRLGSIDGHRAAVAAIPRLLAAIRELVDPPSEPATRTLGRNCGPAGRDRRQARSVSGRRILRRPRSPGR